MSKAVFSSQNPSQNAREPFIPLQDAAEHLSISTKTLRRMIAAQEIPAYRVGNRPGASIRLKISEIEAVLYPMGSLAQ